MFEIECIQNMKQTVLIFGGISVLLFFLFQISKISVLHNQSGGEIFVVISGILFVIVGFVLYHFLGNTDQTQEPTEQLSKENIKKSGLTKSEYKVLKLIAEGLSNDEIGKKLFISESTVKSHVSNILAKLNAKRRTEAVKIGRELKIV